MKKHYRIIIENQKGRHVLLVPVNAESVTLKQMCRFFETLKTCPDWFQEVELIHDLSTLEPLELAQFAHHAAKVLSAVFEIDFLNIEKSVAKDLNETQPLRLVLTLFRLFNKCITDYVPKQLKEFEYKGKAFIIPTAVIDCFQKENNPNLTFGEGLLLLQAKHNYSKAISVINNKQVVNDYSEYFYLLLTMLATLARQKGSNDILPLSDVEIVEYTKKRIKYFEELPMSIALDFWFFFVNSLRG